MELTDEEQQAYQGARGRAQGMAMRILVHLGRVLGADRLIPISSAHIDGCLYHGESGVAFAEALVQGEGHICVPTTLNVGALDLHRPENVRIDEPIREMARRLMQAYVALGCRQTWTCAPYQAGFRPAKGEDIAWAESNAVVFANSVLGARTNRYGDFLDICAALTGRAPRYGLHVPENRRATLRIRTSAVSQRLKRNSVFYPVLGAWLGRNAGSDIAVIEGLPTDLSEDALKALGAAAASTGAVALFHVAGVTPEAPTVEAAGGGAVPEQVLDFTPDEAIRARDSLSTISGVAPDVIALGSPHYSLAEVEAFERVRRGRRLRLPVYLCTGRHVFSVLEHRGQVAEMEGAGVVFITDTCVVVTPILAPQGGVLMTDSGKFAHYSLGNIGYDVLYGSAAECVESAVQGKLAHLQEDWQ